jgi:excinuclease ABC subunit B
MFKLKTDLRPKGDQPDAIKKLVDGIKRGKKEQVLLGATGTGKTFTMANVIQKTQKQTLIIVHNKTLAMQLFQEMKNFFPENDVEYYVSYFDYYRPEAYKPQDDLYIGKKVQRNKDISRMRMKALNSLITKEKAIVVSSVAAIYGCLSPLLYKKAVFSLKLGDKVD